MKVFPQSLRAQLMLLVLMALAAAQVVNLFWFADERSLAVRAALGAEAAERAANAALLLEEAPPSLHPSIIRAASTPLVRFGIAGRPSVDHRTHDQGGAAEARVRAFLGEGFGGEVRAELHEIDSAKLPLAYLNPEMAKAHREMMRGQMLAIELKFSIELSDGQWLNAGTLFERPPLQWPVHSIVTFALSAGFILTAVFWFVLAQVARPLGRLAIAAENLGPEKKVAVLPAAGPQEVRELAGAFDRMQDRISGLVAERTRMLAALGHDLRSPLTAMRVRAELIEEDETRTSMVSLIEEMQEMAETTLSFARGLSASGQAEDCDLGQFLEDLCREMPEGFLLEHGEQVSVCLHTAAMRRALRNVIENALRYGGSARVSYGVHEGCARIAVADDGPGIAEADLEAVFEPFLRLENSRSLATGGHGLGLPIARSILRAHGGDVSLRNSAGGGLCAELTLPLGSAGRQG
ncbi:ATP-binding protein [Leisingera sp. ANG-Vp]|uniref:ATP-binding protein n=1 Tax=Leisingera sp. ANG-Vp TaxID=1577896 RepID=UPI00057D4285|nr:ATP-binding protein [Leisingera sp. ANG-Vp]KIC20048.1 histidine kinase [Leisingera sp. ANG-Vp]